MALVRWNPWTELFSLHNQMDRLFNETLDEFGDRPATDHAALPVDIHETDSEYTIVASVPGMLPENVEVTFDAGILSIRGQHRESTETGEGRWLRRERRIASFFRQLALPSEVQVDQIRAGFENGILTIRVPRSQKALPKRIPVAAVAGQGQNGVPEAAESQV